MTPHPPPEGGESKERRQTPPEKLYLKYGYARPNELMQFWYESGGTDEIYFEYVRADSAELTRLKEELVIRTTAFANLQEECRKLQSALSTRERELKEARDKALEEAAIAIGKGVLCARGEEDMCARCAIQKIRSLRSPTQKGDGE